MSNPIAFHVMHSLIDRRVIFPTPEARADAYRRAHRLGAEFGLGWFHLGTDHVHVVLFCTPERVHRWANSIESSWKQGCGLPVGFARYHAKPVVDQGHLRTLIRYVFAQEQHHGSTLDLDHLGSTAPDLCGGRLLGALAARTTRLHLPRLRPERIESILLSGGRLRSIKEFGPAPAGLVEEPLERVLRDAAAAALGRATLPRSGNLGAQARRALLELAAGPLGTTIEPTRLLGVGRSSLFRLRSLPMDPTIFAAVRWQVAFRLTRRELMASRR